MSMTYCYSLFQRECSFPEQFSCKTDIENIQSRIYSELKAPRYRLVLTCEVLETWKFLVSVLTP